MRLPSGLGRSLGMELSLRVLVSGVVGRLAAGVGLRVTLATTAALGPAGGRMCTGRTVVGWGMVGRRM